MSHNETKNRRILREGQKLFAKELDKQLAGLNRSLEALQNAASLLDGQYIYRIAHTLKGSAAMFGFQRIGKLADQLAKLWEWAQDVAPDAGLAKNAEAGALHEALQATPQLLVGLTMEYDIARVELELIGSDFRFQRERPKVLMLSGRKKEDDIAKGQQLGARDYMPKPFSLVELDMRVKRLLEL